MIIDRLTIAALLILFVCTPLLVQAQETFGVPIPVVANDPNEGSTLGVLLAVITEEEGRITYIMAPVATSNDLTGYGLDFNYFGYPSKDTSYILYFSHTTEGFWGYRGEYKQENLWSGRHTLSSAVSFEHLASNRFFGLGFASKQEDESSYRLRQLRGHLTLTFNLFDDFYGSFALAARKSWIKSGIVLDIPSLDEKFPDIEGIDGSHAIPVQISMEYDTRDSQETPTSGVYSRIFLEAADQGLFSSSSFRRYGAEGRIFLPLLDARSVTAVRGLLETIDGSEIPFYELSALGGGKFLRGFGDGRFRDQRRILLNVEERVRIARLNITNVNLDFEAVFFTDVGQVFGSFNQIQRKNLEFVYGIGLRIVVRDQIVAKVDYGLGSEGSQIFAGLDYPF